MKVKLYDISWDTDGEGVYLPSEVFVECDEESSIQLEGADILSDKYGWCVNSFRWEKVPELDMGGWNNWDKEDLLREVEDRINYRCLQTSGDYKFPNSFEGDILKIIMVYIQKSRDKNEIED